MRSSNSKGQEKSGAVNSETPLENGLPSKEEEDEMGQNVRELAAEVVENVVKMASEAAQEKTATNSSPAKNKGCGLKRLPTIQIDTVPSPPPSPTDLSPLEESNDEDEDDPLDTSDIQLDLQTTEQEVDSSQEDLKEFLKSYVEDLLSQAMVLAEKKLQFAGLPDDDEENSEESEPAQPPPEPIKEPEEEIDDSEIRATAEKVVEEVISKASATVAEKLENSKADLSFPGLPSIQIDTVISAPPSPESEEELPKPQKKWTFKMEDDDTESEKNDSQQTEEKSALITFDEAPEDVQETATNFVKEIVRKAVAMVEEKSTPSVPFNFEDVDLMKNPGPWYIRAREALMRLLRTACFCTPRRSDS